MRSGTVPEMTGGSDALLNSLLQALAQPEAGGERGGLHLRPVCSTVDEAEGWPVVLAATLAEAAGAHLMVGTSPTGTTITFAGAGEDSVRAESAFLKALKTTEGRSRSWCAGFAAAVDEELDALIDEPATRARVGRVARWLEHDRSAAAPLLEVDGRGGRAGAEQGRKAARALLR